MASALELQEQHDDAAWDVLVDASPQGTVFARSGFLRSLGVPFRRFAITAGGKPQALVVGAEHADGTRLGGFDYTPYLGILFLNSPDELARQRVLDEYRLTEFAVQQLTARYAALALPLSWLVTDVRPFMWHNYHEPALGMFQLVPRYTAVLDLDGIDSETFPAQVRACRRQELRKAAAFTVSDAPDIECFLHLYQQTFARQEIELPPAQLALVRRIVQDALEQGYGRLSGCATAQGMAAMTLFLFDRRRAYYLFAANDPEQRNTGAATRLMFENIAYAKQRGVREFDFVGANSPQRADFKLSFNPELKLYFEARYQRPMAP